MRYSTTNPRLRPTRLLLLGAMLGGLVSAAWSAPAGLTPGRTQAVALLVGRSAQLSFERMRRVEVIEPGLVDVVISSLNHLSLYGKKEGTTTVFVWDRRGTHQIEVSVVGESATERLIGDLRRVLGNRLTYSASGEQVLLVEGSLPAPEAQRAHLVLKAYEGKKITLQGGTTGEITIIDMIRSEGAEGSAAMLAAQALRKVLGEDLEYVVWNDKTVLVRGLRGDKADVERVHRVLTAAKSEAVDVVDLVDYEEPQATPPVEDIARAVGDKLQVWRVQGRTVAVSGIVSSKTELENLDKVLETFKDQARVLNLTQVVEPKPALSEVQATLQQIVGDEVKVRPLGNQTLILEGVVPNEKDLAALRDVVTGLKLPYPVIDRMRVAPVRKRQIVVKLRVLDLNRGAIDKLGINYGGLEQKPDGSVGFVNQPFWVKLEGGVDNIFDFAAHVDAMVQNNQAKVLSEPNLLVDDGGDANILVGGEIPVPVAAAGSGGVASVTVQWRPYGVSMNMTATILDDGKQINLKLSPEVSTLDYGNAVTLGGFVIPALKTRKAQTLVTVDNGRSLVLGGMLQSTEATNVNRIPLLGSIPIIGELFRHKDFQEGKSELVIIVTPEIVTDQAAVTAPPEPAQPQ